MERLLKEKSEAIEEETEEVASSLPIWTSASNIPEDLNKRITMRYPVLIDGLVHRGTKVILEEAQSPIRLGLYLIWPLQLQQVRSGSEEIQ